MDKGSSLIIKGSKLKAVQILLLGIGFVAMGIYLVMINKAFGWLCIAFFGLAIPVAILQLLRNSYLKLDLNGFEVNPGINPWKLNWEDVESFYVGKIHGNKMIGIEFSESYSEMKTGRKISSSMSGMEGAINNQFKMSPELICEHLNKWKLDHSTCKNA
jgi:hypothetical protein